MTNEELWSFAMNNIDLMNSSSPRERAEAFNRYKAQKQAEELEEQRKHDEAIARVRNIIKTEGVKVVSIDYEYDLDITLNTGLRVYPDFEDQRWVDKARDIDDMGDPLSDQQVNGVEPEELLCIYEVLIARLQSKRDEIKHTLLVSELAGLNDDKEAE